MLHKGAIFRAKIKFSYFFKIVMHVPNINFATEILQWTSSPLAMWSPYHWLMYNGIVAPLNKPTFPKLWCHVFAMFNSYICTYMYILIHQLSKCLLALGQWIYLSCHTVYCHRTLAVVCTLDKKLTPTNTIFSWMSDWPMKENQLCVVGFHEKIQAEVPACP